MGSRSVRAGFALATFAAVAALALAACQTGDPDVPVVPPSAVPSSSASPSPSEPDVEPGTPEPSTGPEPSAVPVHVSCGALISPQGIYDFNPNFGLLATFTPKTDSPAAVARESDGVACRWLHQTSGATLDVSVARPAPGTLDRLRASASTGSVIQGVNADAYFSLTGNVGTAQAFAGTFWLALSSEYFGAASDAKDLLAEAVSNVTQIP